MSSSGPIFRLEPEELRGVPAFGGDMELGTIVFIIAVIIAGGGFLVGFYLYYQQSMAQRSRDEDRMRRGQARKAASLQSIDGSNYTTDYLDNEDMLRVGGGSSPQSPQSPNTVRNIQDYMSSVEQPQSYQQDGMHGGYGGNNPLPNQPPPRGHAGTYGGASSTSIDDDAMLGSTNRSTRGATTGAGGYGGMVPTQGYSYRNSLPDDDPLLGSGSNQYQSRPVMEQEDYIL